MKIVKLLSLLPVLGLFLFTSCTEEDAVVSVSSQGAGGILTPIKIDIPINFLPADEISGLKSALEGMNTFSGATTVDVSSIMPADFAPYLTTFQNFQVKGVKIMITGTESGTVQDLVLKAGDKTVTIAEYQIGTEYKGNAQLVDLIQSVCTAVLPPLSGSMDASVSGKTDITLDKELIYTLEIDYTFKVPVFDNKSDK